jgi:xylan 1,4-beta-xylosidase
LIKSNVYLYVNKLNTELNNYKISHVYNMKNLSLISLLFCFLSNISLGQMTNAQDSSNARWFPLLAEKEYVNPVIPGFFPDPSVVRVGGDYYCVNSTFEYFPGIIISHSKDLIHWKQIGHVFSKSDELDLNHFWDGMGIWAPDISYYNGEFYVFYCMVQLKKDRSYNVRGNYMVKSKSIFGPWSKPVQLTENGNDPSHFVDNNGDHYMLYAAGIPQGNGTKIVKLNPSCTKIVEGPYWIETEGKKAAPEGPHLIKKDDYYYLTMAASGGLFNGHHMLVARSKNIYGPYLNSPYNPSLTQKNIGAINFHQGHGKIFATQNKEWFTMVISQRWLPGSLKWNPKVRGISQLGRETSLIPLEWTADGWPKDKVSRQPLDIYEKPHLKEHLVFNKSSDEFNSPTVGLPWQFRRNPVDSNVSLTRRKGWLRIYSNNFDLDTFLGRNVIVQRERWLQYTAITRLSFNPKSKEQAGITCYYDTKTYARLGLQRDSLGRLILVLEEMKNGVPSINKISTGIKQTDIYLKLSVDKLYREFSFSYDNEKWYAAGVIDDAAYLSDQGTPNWGFMGTMVGVYAFNRGTGERIPADFDWFRIKSK